MRKTFLKTGLLFLSGAVLFSCKPNLDAPSPEAGSLDLTKYVAVGNSITSGYTDGALFYEGQINSFPNLLSEQFKLVGGGDFKQPLVEMSSAGFGIALNSRYVLSYLTDCRGVTSLGPNAGPGDFNVLAGVSSQGPFNNMGVPGAKATTVLYPGYGSPFKGIGNYNPFFTRMLDPNDYVSASIISKAVAQKPTFFSLFIGNNDVLSYALNGGAGDSITPLAGGPGIGFEASVDAIVASLMANGSKGVIANIPDITNLPYFTVVPYNGLVLDADKAAQINAIPAIANSGITFTPGVNPFLLIDPAYPPFFNMRKMKPNELVLLSAPQDSIRCYGLGSTNPFKSNYVLTETEIAVIQNAIYSYNNKLKALADAKGLAFVDVNAFMAKCKKGIVYNGVSVNATFVTGGAFSLDGIHLTPLGNALLANEFIKSINSKYGSTIPEIDATKYKGIAFP